MKKLYDLIYCTKMYRQFMTCYPRATYLINSMYDIEQDTIVMLIRMNSPKWNKYKILVKRAEKWLSKHNFEDVTNITQRLLSSFDRILRKECKILPKAPLIPLTRLHDSATLTTQSVKGRDGGTPTSLLFKHVAQSLESGYENQEAEKTDTVPSDESRSELTPEEENSL